MIASCQLKSELVSSVSKAFCGRNADTYNLGLLALSLFYVLLVDHQLMCGSVIKKQIFEAD